MHRVHILNREHIFLKPYENCGFNDQSKHTWGWTIDPPAAKEYAVLPDVVDKINPSPCTHVTNELSL